MNKLDLALALITIADTGSIKQAAIKLNQTEAAISKKLKRLEADLNIQLIQRNRRGLSLSQAGQQYYHEVKKALAQFEQAQQTVSQAHASPTGELKVVANSFYAETYILPKLYDFLAQYPKIHLNLEIAEILPDFDIKKMDILLGVSVSGKDSLVRKKIDKTKYKLCASPNYLKEHGIPHTSIELKKLDYIGHSMRRPVNVMFLDKEQILIEPKLLLNNTQLLIQAALNHLGIIWTHENLVLPYLKDNQLCSVLEAQTQESFNIYLYYEFQDYIKPTIKAFMKFFT